MTNTAPRPARLAISLLALVAALSACGKKDAPEAVAEATADTLIFGGPIYTGRGAERVEAVAVKDGAIAATGALASVQSAAGPQTRRIDLDGAAMYPGFVDAHAHLSGIGERELTLNLEGVGSIAELIDIVAAAAAETPEDQPLVGRGWIETGWPEARFPTRADLEEAAPGRVVILVRADGHALVASGAALKAAGVSAATKDPAGGRILRDAAGEPTGMLVDLAMDLLGPLLKAPSEARREEFYRTGGEVYAAYGWTGLHNMSVAAEDVALMERVAGAGDLRIRVYNSLDKSGYDLVRNGPRTDKTGRIVTRAIKLYADGALGSRGALLAEPYADDPATKGLQLITEEEVLPLLDRALRDGVQIATHAIGDKGNTLVLDWYEKTRAAVPAGEQRIAEPRWRVEHAQILNPADIARFRAGGVIASMQPSHAIGDFYFAPARLGDTRLDGAYAWKTLLGAGAVIAGGSDAPVERGDPLIEFYAAVARKDLEGKSGADWRPGEKLSRAEALALFTSGPAYASFAEDSLGVIEPGKRADFTVFSKDIMTAPEAEILTARALMTIVDGEVIFERDANEPVAP
jgi:predicted amidohydrolase YtcJ